MFADGFASQRAHQSVEEFLMLRLVGIHSRLSLPVLLEDHFDSVHHLVSLSVSSLIATTCCLCEMNSTRPARCSNNE